MKSFSQPKCEFGVIFAMEVRICYDFLTQLRVCCVIFVAQFHICISFCKTSAYIIVNFSQNFVLTKASQMHIRNLCHPATQALYKRLFF